MKRPPNKLLALVTICVIAAAGFVPWTLGGARMRSALDQRIGLLTGMEAAATGPVVLRILPWPTVEVHTVAIRDPHKRLLIDAQHVRAELRFLPLVAGRLEPSSITLVLPAIAIDTSALAGLKPAVAGKGPAQSPKKEAGPQARAIAIEGGRIVLLKSNLPKDSTQIGDVNALLDWRGLSSPGRLGGSFIWRGEINQFALRLGNPSALAGDGATAAALRLNSRLGELQLEGSVSSGGGLQFTGKIAAASAALRPLISLMDWSVPVPGPLASMKLSADVRINAASVSLANLKLALDQNDFDGAMTARFGGARPMIAGTLATRQLALDPRNAGFFQIDGPDGTWNRLPLAFERLFAADLDLRLSAGKLRFGRLELEDFAATALTKNGAGELSAVSGRAYGGAMNGAVRVVSGPVLPAVRTRIQFEKIDTARFLRDLTRSQRFSGMASGEIEIGAAGTSVHELVAAATGALRLDIAKGAIRGLDLDRAMDRAQTHPLSIPDEIRTGQTAFEKFQAQAKISNGILSFENAQLQSPTLGVQFAGSISAPARSVEIDIDATQNAPARTAASAPLRLRFEMIGPWDHPALLTDPETLIMRSEAAAPLIRSLQRLRSREVTPTAGPQ